MLILFKFIPKDLLVDTNSSINIDIMNFLSIDCSSEIGSLFIKFENKTFSKNLQSDKSNNDLLMKLIMDFLKEKSLTFNDISNIFVNQGPGNFSGLRSSLSIAKGVSLSKQLNLFGYNTPILSCVKFFSREDFIYSLIKFRNKYFVKKFDKNLNTVSDIQEIKIDEIIKKYDKKLKVVPKNIIQYFDKKILALSNLNVVDLDYNGLEFLQLKGLLNKGSIKPLYLS